MKRKTTRIDEILNKVAEKQESKEKLLKLGTKHFSSKTISRIEECCVNVQSVLTEDNETGKVVKAHRCMNRFCPVCAATSARKKAFMLKTILEAMKENEDYKFLFLTLTVPNVLASDLKTELDEQYKALKRFIQLKEFKKIALGYVRKTEITYNNIRNDYHPHIHLLIAVDSDYFTRENYVKREKWLEIWQNSKKDKSISQVDIRVADESSFRELSKYEAKDKEYLHYSQEVFDVFYEALKGRKTMTYNGCFNEYKKYYENEDLDDYIEKDNNYYTKTKFHEYEKKKYRLKKERELNEEEIEEYNNLKIMEEAIIED